jgi:hypothetical protein
MDKVFYLFALSSLFYFTIEGRWITRPQLNSKYFGQIHQAQIEFGKHEQGHRNHFQRNFGNGTKSETCFLSGGRIIENFDMLHDTVEIKLFDSLLSNGKSLKSYQVRSWDYWNKDILSVLAIPKLNFDGTLSEAFKPGQRNRDMDVLIINYLVMNEISPIGGFDWILIKKLVFNGVECGGYLIKNKRHDESRLDSILINEVISSTTFGEHWNPEL